MNISVNEKNWEKKFLGVWPLTKHVTRAYVRVHAYVCAQWLLNMPLTECLLMFVVDSHFWVFSDFENSSFHFYLFYPSHYYAHSHQRLSIAIYKRTPPSKTRFRGPLKKNLKLEEKIFFENSKMEEKIFFKNSKMEEKIFWKFENGRINIFKNSKLEEKIFKK